MLFAKAFRSIVVAAMACLAVTSCRQDPQAARREFVRKGDADVARGKYQEATLEYRNAILRDERSAEAHYKLAETYAAVSDVPNALREYVRAADLAPDNVDAQLKAGNLLLLARHFDDAKSRARALLKRDPRNASALLLLGNALAGLKNLDEAVAANERAIAMDPKRSGMYINLGVLQFARGNNQEAEAAFLQAVAVDGTSVTAQLGLANFYWASGRPGDSEHALKRALEIGPRDVAANKLMAAFYLSTRRAEEAEAPLKTVVDVAGDAASKLALSDYYVSMGRLDGAAEILRAVAVDPRHFATATIRLALLDSIAGRHDQAERDLEDVLRRDPRNASALAFKAHFLLAARKVPEAQAAAEAAVAADSHSVRAQFVRGKVWLAAGDVNQAKKSFEEAVRLDPHAMEAYLELAQLHFARGDIDTAIQRAEQAVANAPYSLEAQLTLVQVLTGRDDDRPRAEAMLRRLSVQYSGVADVQLAIGALALARGDAPGAQQAYERALTLDPASEDALSRLVAMDVKGNRMAEARDRVNAALARTPREPAILVLAAKLCAVGGDERLAEEYLRKTIDIDPSNIEAYTTLGGLYLSQRKLGDARDEFVEVARHQPRSVAANTMVGLLSHLQGNLSEAEQWYQKALEISPQAAAAANNLAWMYADQNRNLDLGVQLAQRARGLLPNEPEVSDTLGWLYYRKDLLGLAIPLLQTSVESEGENALFQFHLGMAYARQGDDKKARRALELALKLQPGFEGAAEARRTLASLVY